MEDREGTSETKDGNVEAKETIPSFFLLLCNAGEEELLGKSSEGERIVRVISGAFKIFSSVILSKQWH